MAWSNSNPIIYFYYLEIRVSITTEPIEFSISGNLYIGFGKVSGNSIFKFKSCDGFMFFFLQSTNTELWILEAQTLEFHKNNIYLHMQAYSIFFLIDLLKKQEQPSQQITP